MPSYFGRHGRRADGAPSLAFLDPRAMCWSMNAALRLGRVSMRVQRFALAPTTTRSLALGEVEDPGLPGCSAVAAGSRGSVSSENSESQSSIALELLRCVAGAPSQGSPRQTFELRRSLGAGERLSAPVQPSTVCHLDAASVLGASAAAWPFVTSFEPSSPCAKAMPILFNSG